MKLSHNPLFCKQSKTYSAFGENLAADKSTTEEQGLLFSAGIDNPNTTNCQAAFDRRSPIADIPVIEISSIPQEQASKKSCAEFIASCLSQGCTIDMLLENFIASVVTVYQEDCAPEAAKGMLVLILVSTVGMTYTQYKLVIDGFVKARSGKADVDNSQHSVLIKHQIQALVGTLSAIETGIRFFFNIMTVFNVPNASLRYMFATIAGSGKLISFQMASSHKACDVPLSKTLVGKLVYGTLTAPIMPDLIQYATLSTPFVGAIIFSSAIFLLKDTFEVENQALTIVSYTTAFFSGMMGFLIQKCYICNGVMTKSLEKNAQSVESWNKFWYGDNENCNKWQKCAYATKRFVDIVAAIPLTAIDAVDQFINVCCYFVLALLPIQFIAMVQYVSQPALTYCVFFQLFNSAQGIINTYTGRLITEPTPKMQELLTLISLPFGVATAFTMLNLTGEDILKGTNKVFKNTIGENLVTDISETTLLTNIGPTTGTCNRLGNVCKLAKSSIASVGHNMLVRLKGEYS